MDIFGDICGLIFVVFLIIALLAVAGFKFIPTFARILMVLLALGIAVFMIIFMFL